MKGPRPLLSALGASTLVLACTPSEAALKEKRDRERQIEARVAIMNRLRDPDSAKFDEIWVSTRDNETVCGRVNSKNGFGGYIGAQPFIYHQSAALLMEDAMSSDEQANAFLALWKLHCAG